VAQWKPNLETKQSVDALTQTILDNLPGQLGIDEIIPGCEVMNNDTYGVGIGVLPRYITVALGGREHVPVMYRGGVTVTVGAYVTVLHYRDGNIYEVLGAGGAAGTIIAIEHNLLSATHGDTVANAAVRGYLIRGDATPEWERFSALTTGFVVQGDGADVISAAFDWDAMAAGAGSDMVHDHSAADEGGEIPLASLGDYTQGDIIYGDNADWQDLPIGNIGDVLTVNAAGTEPEWAAPAGGGANTLDQAYDEGGAGAGRTITADTGAVYIAGTDGLQVDNTADIEELRVYDDTELTINAGVITRTQTYHRVDTESDDPTDDLVTINGGAEGDILVIHPEDDARTIVVKHNTGNIWLIGEADISLEDAEDHLILIYDGAMWCSIGDGNSGGAGAPHNLLSATHSDTDPQAVSEGSLVYGDATPEWTELVHPGAANRVLQSTAAQVGWSANAVTFPATGAVPVGSGANTQVAYWTAANTLAGDVGLTYNAATDTITIAGDIIMADDHYIGITGDTRIEFDSSDGDIMLHLGDAAGSDEVQVLDSGNNVMSYIDSDGNADFQGYVTTGSLAGVLSHFSIYAAETYTGTATDFYGIASYVGFGPVGAYTSGAHAIHGLVNFYGANSGGGYIIGVHGEVLGWPGLTATTTNAYVAGIQGEIRAINNDCVIAASARLIIPTIIDGSITSGYGIKIEDASGGGSGVITTLYGLYIEDMTQGNTNYAIYSAGGQSYHAGDWRIGASEMFINETINTKQTIGLTINQGANDDEAFAVKSSDVAHGMTLGVETDTYLRIKKVEGGAGGALINGLKDGDGFKGAALWLAGYLGEAVDTTKSTAARGGVEISAAVQSGTWIGNCGANGNLLVVRNNNTTRFIFDAEGSAHADIEWTTFDEDDDLAILDSLEETMLAWRDPVKAEFGEFLSEQRGELERLGIVHFDVENPGHAMVNTTRLSMLLVGAIRQMSQKLQQLETENNA